jgi:hypothetical protein
VDSNPGLPSPSDTSGREPGRGRRRRRAGVLLAAVALVVTALAGFQATAGALPPRCDDGSPPPCDIPDPTTTTTTMPHPDVWNARVTVLDQSGPASFNRTISGSWGGNGYSTPTGTVTWSDPATKLEGNLGLQAAYLPPGFSVGLRMFESGSSGRFCRSMPMAAIPPTGRTVRVLVAGPTVEPAAAIALLGTGLQGVSDVSGATLTISQADLSAQDDGLHLALAGNIHVSIDYAPDFDTDFTYDVVLHVSPSTRIDDPSEVLAVRADPGLLHLDPNGILSSIIVRVAGDVEPQFRSAVAERATSAINDLVNGLDTVRWFTSLGYTVSARSVTTTHDGVTVFPSLCKVD